MDALDITVIKKKSVRGIAALISRSFLLYGVALIGNFLLSLYLTVSDFGVYYIVSAIIAFLSYFSDIGLAAALIQKKEELTSEDLRTTFTVQQILSSLLVLLAICFSVFIRPIYNFPNEGIWLFYALVGSFFLSSLKTIPSILLERKFNFHLLIIPQIIETVSFYTISVFLAWKGLGIMSLTWAVLIRSLLGTVVLYCIAPWRITFGISRVEIKNLLRFGVPFQVNSFLAVIKDDLLTVTLGYLLTSKDIGYIGWAKKWSDMPIRMIMDNVIKVTFPAYSRIQDSKEFLKNAIENTLFGISLIVFPLYVLLIFLVEPIVQLIPGYSQWLPAISSFIFFSLANLVSSISTPLTNVFNAVGKIQITLKLMVGWVITTWLLTLFLVQIMGFNGVSVAVLLVTTSVVLVVYLAKKIAPFSLWSSIRSGTIGSFVLLCVFIIFRGNDPYAIYRQFSIALIGILIYGIVVWYREKVRILRIFGKLRT